MTPEELIKKVRKIEIRTKALSHQVFAGEYHSAFKGRGMAFSEVREYQWGDDVRNMDWNVTARMRAPYVKVFEEERELTVVLLVDISRSGLFGTQGKTKREQIAEIAATLSFSAILNNDKVGCILMSDRVEKFIPPAKGRTHFLHIVREILEYEPQHQETDIGEALRYFSNAIKKRCTTFLLSDFYDTGWTDALKLVAGKHDLVALRLADKREKELMDLGMVKFYDPESSRTVWIDTGSAAVRRMADARYAEHERKVETTMKRYGIDMATLWTGEDFVKPLKGLLARRS